MNQMPPGPSVEPEHVPAAGPLPPRDSRIAYGAMLSGMVAVAAWLVALYGVRELDLLFSIYVVASIGGVALGIAGIVVTRRRRLNGQIFAVTGLTLGLFSALLFYPFVLTVALSHWEF